MDGGVFVVLNIGNGGLIVGASGEVVTEGTGQVIEVSVPTDGGFDWADAEHETVTNASRLYYTDPTTLLHRRYALTDETVQAEQWNFGTSSQGWKRIAKGIVGQDYDFRSARFVVYEYGYGALHTGTDTQFIASQSDLCTNNKGIITILQSGGYGKLAGIRIVHNPSADGDNVYLELNIGTASEDRFSVLMTENYGWEKVLPSEEGSVPSRWSSTELPITGFSIDSTERLYSQGFPVLTEDNLPFDLPSHASTHGIGGTDAVTPSSIGAYNKIPGIVNGDDAFLVQLGVSSGVQSLNRSNIREWLGGIATIKGDGGTITISGNCTLPPTESDLPAHTHDSRYYTETESDARFAPISHNHDNSYNTES